MDGTGVCGWEGMYPSNLLVDGGFCVVVVGVVLLRAVARIKHKYYKSNHKLSVKICARVAFYSNRTMINAMRNLMQADTGGISGRAFGTASARAPLAFLSPCNFPLLTIAGAPTCTF